MLDNYRADFGDTRAPASCQACEAPTYVLPLCAACRRRACERCGERPGQLRRAEQWLCAGCLRREYMPVTIDTNLIARAERAGALSGVQAAALRKQALCVEAARLWRAYVASWGRG
jgi:hypothetical protein